MLCVGTHAPQACMTGASCVVYICATCLHEGLFAWLHLCAQHALRKVHTRLEERMITTWNVALRGITKQTIRIACEIDSKQCNHEHAKTSPHRKPRQAPAMWPSAIIHALLGSTLATLAGQQMSLAGQSAKIQNSICCTCSNGYAGQTHPHMALFTNAPQSTSVHHARTNNLAKHVTQPLYKGVACSTSAAEHQY